MSTGVVLECHAILPDVGRLEGVVACRRDKIVANGLERFKTLRLHALSAVADRRLTFRLKRNLAGLTTSKSHDLRWCKLELTEHDISSLKSAGTVGPHVSRVLVRYRIMEVT